jgi:tRNA(Ile)-lysidine synthase
MGGPDPATSRGIMPETMAGSGPRDRTASAAGNGVAVDPIGIQDLTDRFIAAMDRLGPFEPHPRLAVAVSGGADSMALALVTREWVRRRNGDLIALTVDHGLRSESSAEADVTLRRLAARGIRGSKLIIPELPRGPALAERAREARYRVLLDACAAHGIQHLLLGHHRADQVETLMMRALSSSAVRGLAGMAALAETTFVRILRPLIDLEPSRLRAFLIGHEVAWVEDPSNRDPTALRSRLRTARADPSGTGEGTRAVARSAREAGAYRAGRDRSVALTLARRATIRPEGYALLTPGPIDPESLAALLRTIAGAAHAPPIDAVARLARDPGPATLGGVRIVAAGRLGPGWLLARERRAMRGPVAAAPNVVWDGRFRLAGYPPDGFVPGLVVGALGSRTACSDLAASDAMGFDAARFRNRDGPPALVLHGLPALWSGGKLLAVPHFGMGDSRWRLIFDPRNPASGAPFSFG